MTTTIAYTIQTEGGPELVQAHPATPGLYVYQQLDTVDVGATCRWRLGHHSGLQLARFRTAENAHACADDIADWTAWTDDAEAIKTRIIGAALAGALDTLQPWSRFGLLARIEAAGGHLGNCGLCKLPTGGDS